jgi:hypothetical protein
MKVFAAGILGILLMLVGCAPAAPHQRSAEKPANFDDRVGVSHDRPEDTPFFARSDNQSRTIEPDSVGGTREGDVYMRGAVQIDKVIRSSAHEYMSARVRLKNLTGNELTGEYRIVFFAPGSDPVGSAFSRWKFFTLKPYEYTYIEEDTIIQGSMDLKVYLRSSSGIDLEAPNPALGDITPGSSGAPYVPNPCNACGGEATSDNPCNACGGEATPENPCNACGEEATPANPCNACGGEAAPENPCNACGGDASPDNPCNACGGEGDAPENPENPE